MTTYNVLDHGYLKLIEHWGSDERIIESARMSTDGAFRGWGEEPCSECGGNGNGLDRCNGPEVYQDDCNRCAGKGRTIGDEKLLRYLYEHKHHTPFEMCGLTIEVQAPIFVFRQWHRHRTQSYNELSARYTTLPDLFYIPTPERILESTKASKNKQAAGTGKELSAHSVLFLQDLMHQGYERARADYERLIQNGIAPELARCVLPVAQYSRMRASANLRNWLAFETLRLDSHAQHEIQVYADTLGKIIEQTFPRTWSLWLEGNTK